MLLYQFVLSFILASFASAASLSKRATTPYWYETIQHNGISPFISNGANWQVFRNVKDFGAKGDGVSDDTQAIINAITSGGRGNGNFGTTGAPASVYFPSGTYLITSPIQTFVDTVLIGDAGTLPTLKVSSGFSGSTLLFCKDPSFDATINFYIAVKNFNIDTTAFTSTSMTAIDWSVSQATQLTNINFKLGNGHTGVSTPEGGSGTYMGDLTFTGGHIGINMNNQQYAIKGVSFSNLNTGIKITHCFDLVVQDASFLDVGTGIDGTSGGNGNIGSISLIDSTANSVGTVVSVNQDSGADEALVLENVQVTNSGPTVSASGTTLLSGSVSSTWVRGNVYSTSGSLSTQKGETINTQKSSALLVNGKYFTASPATYASFAVGNVVNIKSVSGLPVHGDGKTDDTANINTILAQNAAAGKVTFFPYGVYLVSSTIKVPPGSRLFGEVWSTISGTGSFFSDASNPKPVVQVGTSGQKGVGQISDMLFTVAQPLPGAILLEVNMAGNNPGDVAFWNTHFRVGGAAGSTVETQCSSLCTAAFMLAHLTSTSSAYIEDMWGWTADHDLDGSHGQTISTGRGMLVESTVATWLVGTAFEHNTLYQYNFVNAQNVFTAMQQCETPYWQGNGGPAQAPSPWAVNSQFSDPNYANCNSGDANCRMAWFLNIQGGSNLYFWGGGFWTFFNNNGGCSGANGSCQDNAVGLFPEPSNMYIWNLNTKSQVTMIMDDGVAVAPQSSNSGSWGGVIGAFLNHADL